MALSPAASAQRAAAEVNTNDRVPQLVDRGRHDLGAAQLTHLRHRGDDVINVDWSLLAACQTAGIASDTLQVGTTEALRAIHQGGNIDIGLKMIAQDSCACCSIRQINLAGTLRGIT